MARIIGIQHRVKKSAEGESRPTVVQVLGGKSFNLETEDDEVVFLGTLEKGDIVAMVLGGSGDYLAFSASRVLKVMDGALVRIPSFVLMNERVRRGFDSKKTDDAALLALLAQEASHLFYVVGDRDRDLIRVREHYRARIDAMKDRIACEQRIRQRVIGMAFCRSGGLYPEGGIEKVFDAAKANDIIYQAVVQEESKRNRELERACKGLDVYAKVFEPIEGCGPSIASRIIANVVDIRRFPRESSFKKYCGVHVADDGTFPRRKNGQVANWSNDCRTAFYLFVDQANRRPDSYWGKYLRQMKANLRVKHPEPVEVVNAAGKKVKRYTDGHIHTMALWRTATRVAEHIFREWSKFQDEAEAMQKAA